MPARLVVVILASQIDKWLDEQHQEAYTISPDLLFLLLGDFFQPFYFLFCDGVSLAIDIGNLFSFEQANVLCFISRQYSTSTLHTVDLRLFIGEAAFFNTIKQRII